MLGSSSISWLSKKQPTVATSSCETEYKAVFIVTVECVWVRRLMADLGVGQDTANTIYTDSQSALVVAKNPISHALTKHIELASGCSISTSQEATYNLLPSPLLLLPVSEQFQPFGTERPWLTTLTFVNLFNSAFESTTLVDSLCHSYSASLLFREIWLV
ncbi:hypothetical protein L7F22_062887 [Adiantum nelumboides]|nr:hypothetical protein [Adiantum nelumboides]